MKRQVIMHNISDGAQGAIESAGYLVQYAISGSREFDIVQTARSVVAKVNPRDPIAKADAIFRFIKNNVAYQRDPWGTEMIQTPRVTLGEKFGDCDCLVCCLMALNIAVGNNVRAVLVGRSVDSFDHIYMQVHDGSNSNDDLHWISYDASNPESIPGWQPSGAKLRKYFYANEFVNENAAVGYTAAQKAAQLKIDLENARIAFENNLNQNRLLVEQQYEVQQRARQEAEKQFDYAQQMRLRQQQEATLIQQEKKRLEEDGLAQIMESKIKLAELTQQKIAIAQEQMKELERLEVIAIAMKEKEDRAKELKTAGFVAGVIFLAGFLYSRKRKNNGLSKNS